VVILKIMHDIRCPVTCCLLTLFACRLAQRRTDYPHLRHHKDDALLLMEMQAWLGVIPRTVNEPCRQHNARDSKLECLVLFAIAHMILYVLLMEKQAWLGVIPRTVSDGLQQVD
jgi:hypothetical protein